MTALDDAIRHAKAATKTPKWLMERVRSDPAYDYTKAELYKGLVDLYAAAHPPAPAPAPVPTPPPPTSSVFAGKGLFTTSEPAFANGLNADWVAFQADPEGSISGYAGSARRCWWEARPRQVSIDACARAGIPYIGQAENQDELNRCLVQNTSGLVAKALVGNAGSWTTLGAQTAADQGWDLIQEWYMNAHPWEHSPDAHGYPRLVNVCFGIYSEGDPGGQGYVAQIPLQPYLDVWHGSYSIWKAEAMTAADRALFNQ